MVSPGVFVEEPVCLGLAVEELVAVWRRPSFSFDVLSLRQPMLTFSDPRSASADGLKSRRRGTGGGLHHAVLLSALVFALRPVG